MDAVGGPLGIAETVAPALVFVIVYTAAGNDITTSGICAVAVAVVFGLARVLRRQTPIYALSGVLGVAISGYIAHRTGKAENFFLLGFLLNIAYAGAFLISMVVRWPLIGVLVSALSASRRGQSLGWYSPKTSRIAPQTSPIEQRSRSASLR
jgi:hypothetical protein